MIARRWHGMVRKTDAEAYLGLMRDHALPDYQGTEGNLGAWCLHHDDGPVTHVEMLTLWRDLAAIEGFAGRPLDRAKYYEFDRLYLIEMEPLVRHFDVIGAPPA